MSLGNHMALLAAAVAIAWAFEDGAGPLFAMFLMGYSTGCSAMEEP